MIGKGTVVRSIHIIFSLLIFILINLSQTALGVKYFNVNDYGAIGDDRTDSTEAFQRAWEEACKWTDDVELQIPQGIYLLHNIEFRGPCMGATSFNNGGVLKAYNNIGSSWIDFNNVDRLSILGGGLFDGQGKEVWGKQEVNGNRPISLSLNSVTNSVVKDMKFIDSKGSHIKVYGCTNVTITHISITAPGDSPNTDGINISHSKKVKVFDSIISTGDDCISFLPGTEEVDIAGIHCGPGHGISIGSLGMRPNEEPVRGITVKNCNFTQTMYGVRIKSWATNIVGLVENVSFQGILIDHSWNPIIIDQNYCPQHNCPEGDSHIQIKNATFVNIKGVSKTDVVVNFQCSKFNPCLIETKDINLVYEHEKEKPTIAKCENVKGVASGNQKPPSCIPKILF